MNDHERGEALPTIERLERQLFLAVLSLVLLMACPRSALANDIELRTLFCPIVLEAPTIDGVVDENEWRGSTTIDRLMRSKSSVQTEGSDNFVSDTIIRIMADESAIYIAFVCGGPDGKPQNPQRRKRDGFLATDNSVQVFVDLDHDHKTNKMFGVDYFGALKITRSLVVARAPFSSM